MEDKNYIFDELTGGKKEGIIGESNFYIEFLDFEKKLKVKKSLIIKNIIEFSDFTPKTDIEFEKGQRFAADDILERNIIINRKSDFLLSEDGRFAIKYSKKLNEEIHLTILTETKSYTGEIILYSPSLDKYFVSNSEGDFIIGQYSTLDLKLFKFRALVPFDKIMIIFIKGRISVIPYNGYSRPEITENSENHIRINLNISHELNTTVLCTDKTKDLIAAEKCIVSIPKIVLSDKSVLYIY